MPETTRRRFTRALQDFVLIEDGFGHRLRESAGGARNDGEVGEANLTALHRLRAFRNARQLLANVDGVVGDAARGLAVVADPLAGRRRVEPPLGLVISKLRGEPGGVFREIEL